jgi:hypothetical protein
LVASAGAVGAVALAARLLSAAAAPAGKAAVKANKPDDVRNSRRETDDVDM